MHSSPPSFCFGYLEKLFVSRSVCSFFFFLPQVMALFFHMHSHFDWSRYCWCIEGARRLDTLHSNTLHSTAAGGTGSARSDGTGGHTSDSYGDEAQAFEGLAGHQAPLLLSQVKSSDTNQFRRAVLAYGFWVMTARGGCPSFRAEVSHTQFSSYGGHDIYSDWKLGRDAASEFPVFFFS